MKFRELMESLQGDFQIRIRKAQKGEAGEIMKEIEAAFKDKKINEKEFDMLSAMCGRKMDQLGESEDLYENYRILATKGMGAEARDHIKVGHGVDYYEPTEGSKHRGTIVSMGKETYVVKDDKTGKKFEFKYFDRKIAKEMLAEQEDKKIQKAATKLVIKMKKDGEENKKIIKALQVNFPSLDALRFLADFKNELVENEELDEATYYTLDKHSNGYNALFSAEKTIHDLLTTVKNGNDFSMSMWNDIKKLLSKVEKDIKENK